VIPLTPKEVVIRIARHVLGERRVHDYLIKRGIELRRLNEGYGNCESRDDSASGDSHCKNCADHEVSENRTSRKTLVFMVDGKWMHGGLTDRFRGMVSAYKFAIEHHLDFKIFHTSPFLLQEILQPNKVDWIIDEKEISRDSAVAKPVLLYREDFDNDSALERQLDASHKQFHLYSCIDTVGEDFPKYFNELFKPSPVLEKELEQYSKLLGFGYTAISFRFQNMLGDFKEFTFKELPDKAKRELMNAALDTLKKEIAHVQESYGKQPETCKILVTAESPTFIAEAEKISNVITVKGKSIHIDFNNSTNVADYLKAFTEFFLISRASKAKLYRNRKYKTYPSNFPKYAAKLGNVPYEIVEG